MTRSARGLPTALARARETTEALENITEMILKKTSDIERLHGQAPALEPVLHRPGDSPLAPELRRPVMALRARVSVLVPSEGCFGRADASAASRRITH